ncbi:CG4820, partial [Drosophila busckii]
MENFCRTCGKTINLDADNCLKIYSPLARPLLRCVRNITNCWLENITGGPIYLCFACQRLIKKIDAFRKRCAKIEAFLAKRKRKREGASVLPSNRNADPLQIEALESNDLVVKADPETNCGGSEHKTQQEHVANSRENVLDEKQPESACSLEETQSKKLKTDTQKYAMRVGKRTMYIRLTNEKQPKRIVDRERQWSSAQPCICEHCGRQFKDGSNLNVHLLRHTGTKNYECNVCHEKCYTLHLLRRHKLKHTEGPYQCTFCGLQYSTNSSRVRHEREACKKGRAPQSKTEIIKRGERTFHCDTCDLWFLRAGNLAQHMNSSNHITNERRKQRKSQSKLNK